MPQKKSKHKNEISSTNDEKKTNKTNKAKAKNKGEARISFTNCLKVDTSNAPESPLRVPFLPEAIRTFYCSPLVSLGIHFPHHCLSTLQPGIATEEEDQGRQKNSREETTKYYSR